MFQVYVALIGSVLVIFVILTILKRRAEKRRIAKEEFLKTLDESDITTVKEALYQAGILEKESEDDYTCYFLSSRVFDLYTPLEFAPVIGSLLNEDTVYLGTVVSLVLDLNPSQKEVDQFISIARRRHYDVGDRLIGEFATQTERREEDKRLFDRAQKIRRGAKILKKM